MASKGITGKGLTQFARLMPGAFAFHATRGKYLRPKHIELFDDVALKIASGKIKKLMVQCPPRHGKSEYWSQYFPVWFVGNYPEKRVILTSYESSYAQTWGRKCRDLVEEFGESVFGVELNPASKASNRWDLIAQRGGMSTAGAGSSITGKGAHLLIIDDPVKNDQEANSKLKRDQLYEWYRATAFTRLEPGGCVVLIMTRWHEDDLAGRLLEAEKDEWTVINLPALAEEEDALGRAYGEALWAERYDTKKLEEIRHSIGEHWFSALYQQHPRPREGRLFAEPNFTDDVPRENVHYTIGADLAYTASTKADYSAVVVMARSHNDERRYVVHVERWQSAITDTIERLRRIQTLYPVPIRVEANGPQKAVCDVIENSGVRVERIIPTSDKYARAQPVAEAWKKGNIILPRTALWLPEYLNELMSFSGMNDMHDDQVDATTNAFQQQTESFRITFL